MINIIKQLCFDKCDYDLLKNNVLFCKVNYYYVENR